MRVNRKIVVVSGTPVHILSGYTTGLAVALGYPQPVYGSRIQIQMAHGSTGYGIFFDGIYGVDNVGNPRVPAAANVGDVTSEVPAPVVAGQPGQPYIDYAPSYSGSGMDLRCMWIDGSHSGDVIIVTFDQQQEGR